jgi:type II secretory pathway pseudopilin PulG
MVYTISIIDIIIQSANIVGILAYVAVSRLLSHQLKRINQRNQQILTAQNLARSTSMRSVSAIEETSGSIQPADEGECLSQSRTRKLLQRATRKISSQVSAQVQEMVEAPRMGTEIRAGTKENYTSPQDTQSSAGKPTKTGVVVHGGQIKKVEFPPTLTGTSPPSSSSEEMTLRSQMTI